MKPQFLATLSATVLMALFGGCSLLTPKEDPTRYFVLSGSVQSTIATKSGLRLLVGPVSIPAYLDHKEIVTAGAGQNLTLAEYHLWAEPIDKAISRVLAKNVSRLLDTPVVASFPDMDFDYDYKVSVIVRDFKMGADGKVRLDASYGVDGTRDSVIDPAAASRRIAIDVAQPLDYSLIAAAMSRGLDELSQQIGRDVLNHHRRSENAEKKAAAEAEAEAEASANGEAGDGEP